MTKRFIPVLAACLFLMVGTAQAAHLPCIPPLPIPRGESRSCKRSADGRQTGSFTAKPLSDKLPRRFASGPRTA